MGKVLVEVSARHVHVSQKDLEILFGADAVLTNKKDLSQPGQFACEERVDLVGPKGTQKGVSILGPVRPATQVEISLTDARKLGIAAPIRESGDIAGSPGCTLIGPNGSVDIDCGVVVAKRHIHVTPEEAALFRVMDKQIVKVQVGQEDRGLIFDQVVVRVNPNFSAAMHIDTDEANAAALGMNSQGEIIVG